MTIEDNKATVRAFYDALSRKDYDALANCCHQDFIFYHQIDTPHRGVEGFISSEKKKFDSCAQWQMPIHHIIAEGDKVAAYLVFEGIYLGKTPGMAAQHLRFPALMQLTLKDGKIIEKRAHFDRQDIRDQLTKSNHHLVTGMDGAKQRHDVT
jgi:predicted ester cyclase